MRKFTKGLLLTLVATAMSVGAYAQETEIDPNQEGGAPGATIDGYYRVINAGYKDLRKTGVVYISAPTTAQPQKTPDEAVTLPGTIMYINAEDMTNNPEVYGRYVDVNPSDLIVNNLRSQGVDASAAIYGPLVKQLREGFAVGLKNLNNKQKWGFSDTEMADIIDQMFFYMQMFMEPTDVDGEEAWYLKSTTPNTKPLIEALKEKQIEIDFNGQEPSEWAWDKLIETALAYYETQGDDQLKEQWEYFIYIQDRIHIGHTYYLIGGIVRTDLSTFQYHDPGAEKAEFISFANNNQYDYATNPILIPEIERAGNFSKWFIEPVVPGTETNGLDYFAVKGGVVGLDGHYYTSIYTDFPMQIVQNGETVENGGKTVRVWGIPDSPQLGTFDTSNGQVGYAVTTEYTDIVPARTPVVVECLKSARENNLLQPVLTPMSEDPHGESFLKGIFFEGFFDINGTTASDEDQFTYYYMPLEEGTPVARKLIRVLNRGNNALNPVGFFKYTGGSILPNKAFMILDTQMANANIMLISEEDFNALGISEVATTTTENATIYDIQGRIVTNPTKGLYIVNGKKMVIK